jgi:hypothetical protein
MRYPKTFIEQVKSTFPEWDEIHRSLDRGLPFVGDYLDEKRRLRLKPGDILTAFENDQQDSIYLEAKQAVAAAALYRQWCRLVRTRIRTAAASQPRSQERM